MKSFALATGLAVCLAVPSNARAAGETGWMLNGAPLGSGQTALLGEIGWPGLQLSLMHGQSPTVDLGGFFAFNFGFEGISMSNPPLGFKFAGLLRVHLLQSHNFTMGMRFTPGLAVYFPSSGRAIVGFSMPFELVAGVLVLPQLSLNFGFSVPFAVFVTPDVFAVMPLMPGAGVEYRVDPSLTLTFDMRFGPAVYLTRAWNPFDFRMLFGVGHRF